MSEAIKSIRPFGIDLCSAVRTAGSTAALPSSTAETSTKAPQKAAERCPDAASEADFLEHCFIAKGVLIGSSNYFTAGPKRSKLDQSEQQVFRSHVVVVEPLSLLACKRQSLLGTRSKIIHYWASDATVRCVTMLKIGMTPRVTGRIAGAVAGRQDNNPLFATGKVTS